MKTKIKDIIKLLFFLGLGFFFIWLFVRRLDSNERQEILFSIRNANYFWVLFSVILGVLSHVLRALRWKMLLKPLGYKPKNINIISAVFLGYFANLAFPRLGEVVRCTILTKYEKIPFAKSFGTVITERIVDMFVFLFVAILTFVLQGDLFSNYLQTRFYDPIAQKANLTIGMLPFLLLICLGILVICVAIWVIFKKNIKQTSIYNKLIKIYRGLIEGITSLLKIKQLGKFLLISLAIWFLYFLMAYVVFFSLESCKNLPLVVGLATLTFGTVGIIIVPGGIGIYPAIISEVLNIYGVESNQGYSMGWLIWLSQNIAVLVVGLVAIVSLPLLNKKIKNEIEHRDT